MRFVVCIAAFAPSVAFACAMPRDMDRDLAVAMVDIDAALVVPVPTAPVRPEPPRPVAPTVIPEVTAPPMVQPQS